MIKRQSRYHFAPLIRRKQRTEPDEALFNICDNVSMQQHRAFGGARRPAGILQDSDVFAGQRQKLWLGAFCLMQQGGETAGAGRLAFGTAFLTWRETKLMR